MPAEGRELPVERVGGVPADFLRAEDSARFYPKDVEPRGFGSALRRRRATIALCLLAALVATAVLTYAWPETYESSASFLLEAGPARDGAPLAVLENLGRGGSLETEMLLLRSRRVVEQVVDALDLHVSVETPRGERLPGDVFDAFAADEHARPGDVQLLASKGHVVAREVGSDRVLARSAGTSHLAFLGIRATLPARVLDDGPLTVRILPFARAVQNVQDRISVSPVTQDAALMRLTCRASTPTYAQVVCDAVAGRYLQLRTEMQRADASSTAEFLREQVMHVGTGLTALEDSLQAFKSLNQVVAPEEQATEEVRRFAQLRAQRDLVDAERRSIQGLIADVESGQDHRRPHDLSSFPSFLKSQAVSELVGTLVQLENRRSELSVRRTERHPELAELSARIADVEKQLHSVATGYDAALGAEVDALDATLASATGELTAMPVQQVETMRLQRRVSLLEELYQLLKTRLQEAEVARAVDLPAVQLIDAASLPLDPAWPRLPLNLVLAVMLGLGCGLAVATWQERRDTRLYDRGEFLRETDLPILGLIPRLRRGGALVPSSLDASVSQASRATPASGWRRLPAAPGGAAAVALEAFRSLGVELVFAGRHRELRSVALTSSSRGEGKTFVTCNLALARASHGSRTLLIDADLRAGGAGDFFGVPPETPGLSEVLSGTVLPEQAWRRVSVAGGGELWVLPAGRTKEHSARLLETPGLRRLIEGAAELFDLVLVDTPPLNVLTDAASVAACVDAALLVVRGGVTDREALELTVDRLNRLEGPVLGLILNSVQLPSSYIHYGANPRGYRRPAA